MAEILVTSEMFIQRLRSEAGVGGIGDELVSVDARGIEAATVWGVSGGMVIPITFASPCGIMLDKRHIYAVPSRLRLNDWGPSGD
jgi:hypothetical protein